MIGFDGLASSSIRRFSRSEFILPDYLDNFLNQGSKENSYILNILKSQFKSSEKFIHKNYFSFLFLNYLNRAFRESASIMILNILLIIIKMN